MVIVGIISLLLSLAFVWGYQIENYREIWLSPAVVLAFLGILCANFCLIGFFYALLDGKFGRNIGWKKSVSTGTISTADKASSGTSATVSRLASWKVFLISFAGIFILFSVSFLALYPGLFVFDASWQLEMYRYHKISEHQPVLHTLILGFFVEHFKSDDWHINRGVVAYTVIQYVLAALVMSYANTFIYKKTKRILLLVIGILFYGAFPTIVLQVMSSTKDSYFLIVMILLVTLCLEEFAESRGTDPSAGSIAETGAGNSEKIARTIRILRLALIIISGTLAAIFRNNCIYAVPFLIIPLFIFFKEKIKTTLIITAGIVILFAAYKLLLVPAVIDEKVDGREFYSVPAQQMIRIYKDKDADITGAQRNLIERLFEAEGIEEYQPKIADKAKAALDMEYYKNHRNEIKRLYLDMIKKNPKTAFEAFIELSCGMWYPGCRLTIFDDGRYGYWVVGCYPPAVVNSQLEPLHQYYKLFENSDFVTRNPVTSLLFAPGTFFCFFAVMFGYAVDKKRKGFISVFIFILMLWATYLLGPLAMVRYAIYLYGIVPLYSLLFLEKK